MASTTAQKLRIKEGVIVRTVNAPAGYAESLGLLPGEAKVSPTANNFNQVHWFVKDRAQLEEELPTVLPMVKADTICWIFFPKGSSKVQTDLTRDKGWDNLLKHDIRWLSLVSFDDTWSAFSMRRETGEGKKKEAEPKEHEILKYIDARNKIVYLPEDMEAAFQKNQKQRSFFDSLSFTNRKEYVAWVVSAKKPETRIIRITKTIERLGKEWKNPANR